MTGKTKAKVSKAKKSVRVTKSKKPGSKKPELSKSKSKSKSKSIPKIPLIGYEDSNHVRRNIVIFPLSNWHTSHLAYYETSGTSNQGFQTYSGAWVPMVGCLAHPIPALELDQGHIVKLSHVNDILPKRHIPAWLVHFAKSHLYADLAPLLEKPLAFLQADIYSMPAHEVETRIEQVKRIDHIVRFFESYFLTWEQVQASAQIAPHQGFWFVYPEWRDFALTHDYRDAAFHKRDGPIDTVYLDIDMRHYVGWEPVNRFLSEHDAFLDANQIYQSSGEQLAKWRAMYPPGEKDHVQKWNAIHLYLSTRAMTVKLVPNGANVFA